MTEKTNPIDLHFDMMPMEDCYVYYRLSDPQQGLSPVSDLLISYYDPLFNDYWTHWNGVMNFQPDAAVHNPEQAFAELACYYGFANRLVAERALMMFARIEECDWARKMLVGGSYDRLKTAGMVGRWVHPQQ